MAAISSVPNSVILEDIYVFADETADEPIPNELTSVFCNPIVIVSEGLIPICIATEALDPSSKFTPLKLVLEDIESISEDNALTSA